MKKPIIGITLDEEEKATYSNYPWYAARRNYSDSIEKAGGTSIFLPNNPKSINVITCLKKKTKKDIDQLIKYIGFNISSSFVIGYGLDFEQKYRGLNSIYNLKSHTES